MRTTSSNGSVAAITTTTATTTIVTIIIITTIIEHATQFLFFYSHILLHSQNETKNKKKHIRTLTYKLSCLVLYTLNMGNKISLVHTSSTRNRNNVGFII